MLASSFSFLPVLNEQKQWCLLSDFAIATYLGASRAERKKRLALPLDNAAEVNLALAECVTEETSVEDALKVLKEAPLLVCRDGNSKRLVGIVTAFDLM